MGLPLVFTRKPYQKVNQHPDVVPFPSQLSVYRTLLDIVSGMQYLHSLGLVHGDLMRFSSPPSPTPAALSSGAPQCHVTSCPFPVLLRLLLCQVRHQAAFI